MNRLLYRFRFDRNLPFDEVEATLMLAILAVQGLHGESRTCLDAAHSLDAEKRVIVINADTNVGADLNKLFVSFARREFGETAFRVERVGAKPNRAVA